MLPQKRSPMPASSEPLPELEDTLVNEEHRKMVVEKLSERGPSIIPQLISYLLLEDRLLELTVSEILLTMGENALPSLLTILDDPTTESMITTFLLSVLGEMEDENALSTFLSFLKSENPEERKMAMRGLSRLNGPLPLDEVLPCTYDTNPAVRKYCARALEGYEQPAALQALTRLLADDHFSVRFAATESLKNTGSTTQPYLLQILDDEQSYPPYARDLAGNLVEEFKKTDP
jgi:HEAT repeat protein